MKKSIYVLRLDNIQSEIGSKILKPNGFKKRGRCYNRITSDNLVQVITFQIGQSWRGDNDKFSVHIGIRVPESFERTFTDVIPPKPFYQDYHCNIRTAITESLGNTYKNRDGLFANAKLFYLDTDDYQSIIDEIIDKIDKHVLPMFADLDTREKVISNRLKYHEKYKNFESTLPLPEVIYLEEAMIYGHGGNLDKAKELLQKSYDNAGLSNFQDHVEELARKSGIVLDTSTRCK